MSRGRLRLVGATARLTAPGLCPGNQTFPGTALSINRPSSRKPYPFLSKLFYLLTFVQEKGVILSIVRLKLPFIPEKALFLSDLKPKVK